MCTTSAEKHRKENYEENFNERIKKDSENIMITSMEIFEKNTNQKRWTVVQRPTRRHEASKLDSDMTISAS